MSRRGTCRPAENMRAGGPRPRGRAEVKSNSSPPLGRNFPLAPRFFRVKFAAFDLGFFLAVSQDFARARRTEQRRIEPGILRIETKERTTAAAHPGRHP